MGCGAFWWRFGGVWSRVVVCGGVRHVCCCVYLFVCVLLVWCSFGGDCVGD